MQFEDRDTGLMLWLVNWRCETERISKPDEIRGATQHNAVSQRVRNRVE
jgi:hypothetical protein